eukprot:2016515-Ditylum_brightwellii.AAC.1
MPPPPPLHTNDPPPPLHTNDPPSVLNIPPTPTTDFDTNEKHTQSGIDGMQEVVGWGDSTTELPPPPPLCKHDLPSPLCKMIL